MSCLRRDLLPPAKSFYEKELGKLSRPSRGWAKANCCFHRSKSRTSFSVNLDSGAFYCHGCGAKGGDIVSFLRQRDGLGFKEACQQLGCWDEDGQQRTGKVHPGRLVPYLVIRFIIDSVEYHAEVNDEPKSEVQLLRSFHADASDRLTEIYHGAAEQFDGEEEVQWGVLASSWQLIQAELEAANVT
jgi:hypothetical protein